MSLVGNGIKSKEAGKSSITTAFTSLFFGIKAIRLKGDLGKRGFVNRSNFSQAHPFFRKYRLKCQKKAVYEQNYALYSKNCFDCAFERNTRLFFQRFLRNPLRQRCALQLDFIFQEPFLQTYLDAVSLFSLFFKEFSVSYLLLKTKRPQFFLSYKLKLELTVFFICL